MDQAIGAGIVIVVLGGYFYLNYFVASRVAARIASFFAKENDDEIIAYDEDRGMGRSVWTPVSRFDQRFKYWFFLVMVPLVIYVNYKFWDRIWATLDTIVTTLAGFAARFL